MAHLILGEHPDGLTVRLVHGDGMTLAATLTDDTGTEIDWPAAPSLEFAGPEQDTIATHAATIDGPVASWSLTRAQVDTIWTASATRFAGPSTYVRALLPDGDNGSVEYAGKVAWSDGWTAGTQLQVKTFTRPIPVPGSGGASDSLTVVNGGTVTLDDAKAEGSLAGYRVKASTGFTAAAGSVTLPTGAYTFERTAAGWTYYAATGTALAQAAADTTSPIAGTLMATGGAQQVDLAVSGASDAVALSATPYSFSTDGGSTWGAWQASPNATMTGLSAGQVSCRHRVRDAAGNITVGSPVTATVTAPASWTTFFRDTFTAIDGTTVAGHTTDTGGLTWVKGFPWLGPDASLEHVTIEGNQFHDDRVSAVTSTWHYVDFPAPNAATKMRFTAVYEIDHAGTSINGDLIFRFVNGSGYSITITSAGALTLGDGATGSPSAAPLSGTLVAEVNGTALTVTVNGSTVATGTLAAPLAPASFAIRSNANAGSGDPTGQHSWNSVNEVKMEVIA